MSGFDLMKTAAQPAKIAAVENVKPWAAERALADAAAARRAKADAALKVKEDAMWMQRLVDDDVLNKIFVRIRMADYEITKDASADPRIMWPKTWGNADLELPSWFAIIARAGICTHFNVEGCTGRDCKFHETCLICKSPGHGTLWSTTDLDDGGDGTKWSYMCPHVQAMHVAGLDVMDATEVVDYVKGLVDEKAGTTASPPLDAGAGAAGAAGAAVATAGAAVVARVNAVAALKVAANAVRTQRLATDSVLDAILIRIRLADYEIGNDLRTDPRTMWSTTWGNAELGLPSWFTIIARSGICMYFNRHNCTNKRCKFDEVCLVCSSPKHGAMWSKTDEDDTGDGSKWSYMCPYVDALRKIGLDVMNATEVVDYVKGLADEKASDAASPLFCANAGAGAGADDA